jgi:hypothetical protein
MERLAGEQLSLIAESDFDCPPSNDWAIDTDPCPPLRERSIDEIRQTFVSLSRGGQNKNSPTPPVALHSGGQPQTRITSMEGNGGQTSNNGGGQFKNGCNRAEVSSACVVPSNRLFDRPAARLRDRSEGDEGTWVEIQHRKNGSFKYLRWREFKTGIKRSKYLGKVA